MARGNLDDLAAFARERSFTLAAGWLGVSPSALSHATREPEARLGVRLLARTTRSAAPTEAGQRLLGTLRPALAEIDAGLATLRATPETPAGTVRITAVKHAVQTLPVPPLPGFTPRITRTSAWRSTWTTASPTSSRRATTWASASPAASTRT